MTTTPDLIDIQAQPDDRDVAIDQVGVSELRHPVVVRDGDRTCQRTIATIAMSVGLPPVAKGTHMSRFLEVLADWHENVGLATLPSLLRSVEARLKAVSARVELRFPLFLERSAPVSGARGLMDFDCWLRAESDSGLTKLALGVRVPITSLCPCSKAISDYGAHNQRGYVTIEAEIHDDASGGACHVTFEELIAIAESAGSAPVYPVLKRDDERFVTMQAYDAPMFVEDIVRNVAVRVRELPRIKRYWIDVVNHESIHNHSAFAQVRG